MYSLAVRPLSYQSSCVIPGCATSTRNSAARPWEACENGTVNSAAIAGAIVLGGAGIFAWGMVYPQSQLFGPTIRRLGDSSALALTFDDGPNPAITPSLLDLLDRYDVRATFFLIGHHVRAFPALTREIAARGHGIGNHTETHPNLALLSPRNLRKELELCRGAISSAVRSEIRWMRPPYGFRGPQLSGTVRELGYSGVVMWSRWAWDWKPQPAAPVIKRLRRVAGGDIVLMHDGDPVLPEGDRRHVIAALEHWLPRWKDAGLRFVTLDVLRGDASSNLAAPASGKI
jgi:peptidoglycan-N-acetylglucosamine deacetylase